MSDQTNPLATVSTFPQPAAQAPELSPVEKAQQAYIEERRKLSQIHQDLVRSLESRVTGTGNVWDALIAGGRPTRTGSAFEGIGAMGTELGRQEQESKKAGFDIAKMRAELAAQQLGFAKEDIELARNRQLTQTMTGILTGKISPDQASALGFSQEQMSVFAQMPNEYKATILAQFASGDAKGGIEAMQKYMFEQSKDPEKVKELKYYLGQLKSPAAKAFAQNLAANNYFLGNPSERAKTILDIRKSVDAGEIPRNEADILISGLTGMGGQVTPTQPSTQPPSTQAAPMGGMQIPPEDQAKRDREAAEIRRREVTGEGIPTANVIDGSSAGLDPRLSPKQRRELIAKEREADIEVSKNIRLKSSENAEKDLVASATTAKSAVSKITALNRILELGPDAPQGALQPLITNVENLFASFGYAGKDLTNAQVVQSTISSILSNYMKELGARGLTDTDMKIIGESLPRLNTSKAARDNIAKILIKSYSKDLEEFRYLRVNESRVNPYIAGTRGTPLFYIEWLESEKIPQELKRRYQNEDEVGKKNLINRFNKKFGIGTAEDILKLR